MSPSKFGAPHVNPSNTDIAKQLKLAQRVEKIMETAVLAGPKRIGPRKLLVAPANRDGAPPNVQHVHHGILASFAKAGYDKHRPQVGICIQFMSSEGKQRLIEHNRRFSEGQPLLPPIEEGEAMYGTLAGSHLNLALRCIRAGLQSPSCDIQALRKSPSLEAVVTEGHQWWVLPEDTSLASQLEVSLWRNQDQHENQAVHEIEILKCIMQATQELAVLSSIVGTQDIVAKAFRRSPAKVKEVALQALAKYYSLHASGGTKYLADELIDYHSQVVNPRDLVITTAFFQHLASEKIFEKTPFLRHYLVLVQYTKEKVRSSVGQPDASHFLDNKSLDGLARKPDQVVQLEAYLKDFRNLTLPILEKTMSPPVARLEFFGLADLLIRVTFAKALKGDISIKLPQGVGLTPSKVKAICWQWAEHLEKKYHDLNLTSLVEFEPPETPQYRDVEHFEFDTEQLKENLEEKTGHEFKHGDRVCLLRRISVNIPIPKNPSFRKDIQAGAVGVVQGWIDESFRQVLIEFETKIKGHPHKHIEKCFPRNIIKEENYSKLAKEVDAEEAAEDETAQKDEKEKKLPKEFQWLLADSEPSDVIVDKTWSKYISDRDSTQECWFLKARSAVCLDALMHSLSHPGDLDFIICHRKNSKGIYLTEVWTSRRFEAFEIALAPASCEIKDRLYTSANAAMIQVPLRGEGSHLEGKLLAQDGRGRSSISSPGTIETDPQMGSIFWVIERTSNKKDANLVLESVSFNIKIDVNFEAHNKQPSKKRKTSKSSESQPGDASQEWSTLETPQLPILVNPEAIEKHSKLLAIEDARLAMAAKKQKEKDLAAKGSK
jgi:hypothetical protein